MKTPNHLHPFVAGTQVNGSAQWTTDRDPGSTSEAEGSSALQYHVMRSCLACCSHPHAVRATLYILYVLSILALAARQTTTFASSTINVPLIMQQSHAPRVQQAPMKAAVKPSAAAKQRVPSAASPLPTVIGQAPTGVRAPRLSLESVKKAVLLAPARIQPASPRTTLPLLEARHTPQAAPKQAKAADIRVIRFGVAPKAAQPATQAATLTAVSTPIAAPVSQAANSAITTGEAASRALSSDLLAQAGAPMRKVITVSALKLPPASEPLPTWMRGSVLPIEGVMAASLPPSLPDSTLSGKADGKRMAQNPYAPPLRQPTRPVVNSDRLPNQLEVAVGTFVVLVTKSDLDTVAVAEPGVADVSVVNSRALLINGKKQGITSVVIVDRAKIRQYQVRVAPAPGARPRDVAAAIGLENVSVRPLRDALVLEGDVNSEEEARQAVEIASIFSPKVVNQLRVREGLLLDNAQSQAAAAQIRDAINLPDINVRIIGETVLLEGKVDNAAQRQRAEAIAGALSKRKVLSLFEAPTLTIDQVRESLGLAQTAETANTAPAVTVRQVGDQIIMEGIVPVQARIDEAMVIAARTGLQVVNRLQLPAAVPQEAAFLETVRTSIGRPGVSVRGTAKRLILEGTVPDTNAAVAAEQIARAFAPEVDNLLTTPSPTLVNVELSFVEINRTNLRSLGVTFPNLLDNSAGTNIGAIGIGQGNPTTLGATFEARLRAEVSTGNARLLSNPRTTVLSGRTATFQVGGQIPIPITSLAANGLATTSVMFKDFGILVDVIPNATTNGVVTMRVRTEVSEVDFDNLGVNIGFGGRIPGFTRRSSVTEVTVQPNGTVALGGLIQNNMTRAVTSIPVLGKIPILGALFTSKRFQRNETELVIFVTPTVLPNPLAPGTTAPAGVVAVGNTTNVGTVTGNPGIASFNSGAIFTPAGTTGGATP